MDRGLTSRLWKRLMSFWSGEWSTVGGMEDEVLTNELKTKYGQSDPRGGRHVGGIGGQTLDINLCRCHHVTIKVLGPFINNRRPSHAQHPFKGQSTPFKDEVSKEGKLTNRSELE